MASPNGIMRPTTSLSLAFLLGLALTQTNIAASEPGYLDFDNLPETNFSCKGKVIGGYYADVETGCQMFHVCTIGQKGEITDIKFLCLNGTVFDQETRVCERIDEVDCARSESFFGLNLELYGNQPASLGIAPEETECSEDCTTISSIDYSDEAESTTSPLVVIATSTTTPLPSPQTTTPITPQRPRTTQRLRLTTSETTTPSAPLSGDSHQALATLLALHNVYSQPQPPPQPPSPSVINSAFAPSSPDGHLHQAHEAFGGGESTHEPPLKQYNTFRERPQPADYVHGYPRHHFPLTSSQKPPSANYHHFENSDTHFTHTFETGRPFEFHFVKQGSTTTSTPTPQFASEEVGDTLPQPAAISVVTSTSSSTSIKTSGKVRTSFFHPNSTGVPTGYEEYREGDTDPFFHDVPKILRPGRRRRSDRIRTKRNVRGDSKCTSKTEFLQNLLGSIDILQDERQKLFNFFKESEPEMGEDFKRMDTSGFLKVLENKIGSVNLGSNPQLRRMDTEVEEDTSGTKRPKRQVSKYEHGQRQAADKMEVEQRNSGVILRELLNTIVSNQESEKNLQEESASEEPNEGFNIKPQWDPILKGDISIYFPVDVPEGLTSRVHRVNSHGKGQEDSTSEPGVVLLRQFERSMEDFTQKDNKYFSSEHELILKTVNKKNGTQSATNIRKVTNNYSSDQVDKQQNRHLEGGVTKPFVEFSDRSKGAVGDDFKRADIEEHGSIARVDYDLEEVEGKRLNRGQGEVTKQLQASRLQNSILKQSGVGGGMQLDAVLKPRVEYDQEVLKQVSTFFTVLENRIKADLLREEESQAPKNREILQVQNYKTKQQDMKNTDLERIEARQNKQGNGVRTEANPEWGILNHIREFLAAFADAIKTQEGKENVEESLLLIGPGTNNAEGADSQSQQYSGRVNSGTFLESEKIRGRSDFTIGRLKGRTLDTVDYEDTGDISIEFPQDSITTTDSVGKHLSENEDLILIDDNLKAAEESKDIPGTLPESSQEKSNLGVLGPKIENLRRQNSSNELRDLPIEFDDFSRPLMEIGHDFLEADTPKFLGKKRTKRQVARRQNIDTEQFGAGRRKTDQRQPPKNQDSVKPVTEYVDEGEFTTVEYRQRGGAATVRPPPSKQPPPQQQARLKTRFDAYKETTILSGTKVMAESHPGTRRHTGLHSGTLRFPKNLATVRYQNLNQKNASERFVPVYEVPSEPSTESSNVKPIEMRPMSDEAPRRRQRTRGNVYIRKITSENGPQPPQFSSRKTAPQEQVTVPTIRKAYRQPLPPGSPKHHTSVPQPSESTPQSLSSSPSPRKVHHRQPPPTITPRPHAETSQSPTVTPRNLKLSQDLQPTTGPPRKVTVVRRRGTPPSRNRPPTTTEAPSTTPNLKPDPNFSCEGKVKGGFYADTNSDCRGFFICSQGEINGPLLKSHFWCGTTTKFNQRSRTCQAETLVECSVSQRYYHLNDDFRVPETEEELLGGFEPTKVQ